MMCPGGGLSRPIFNKSTRFEDMRSVDEERVPYRRPAAKKLVNKAAGLKSREDDLDLAEFSRGPKSVQPSVRQHASRPSFLDGLCCPSLIED
ncbi:hypothetical protein Sjap_003864 [Stephania japonica]|uniref:Uncharacterized protein n=1 Tax=Stephania japonica TaxID=461633 RepID=A0AAP0PVW7_9MAGN